MNIFPNDLAWLVMTGLNTNFLALKKVVFRDSSAAETELIVDFIEFL